LGSVRAIGIYAFAVAAVAIGILINSRVDAFCSEVWHGYAGSVLVNGGKKVSG